jgi:glycosyltransferase involved in cell wall biosynthesis
LEWTPVTGSQPRILFVVNHAGFFLSHRLPLALAARRAGYDVIVVTPKSRHAPLIEAAGLTWAPLTMSRSGTRPWTEAMTLASLYRTYRRLRPDLVHHVTSKPVLYGTPIARLAGVRAVVNAIAGMGLYFSHDSSGSGALRSLLSAGYRTALRHPNMRVIFQNEAQRDEFVRRGWARAAQSVLIRGSGVDTTVFTPPATPPNGVPLVVLVSRMLYSKGVGEFVEAAERLRRNGVNARFALIGDADPDNPGSIQEQQLRAWHDQGSVEYWGRREDIAAVLPAAAIACLPTYYPEGVPKSLIEAAACGLPIVTTDIPGCRDLVTDGLNGLIVPFKDVESLITALQTLLDDPPLRARMGKAGRARVLQEYSLTRVVDEHLALYKELLA